MAYLYKKKCCYIYIPLLSSFFELERRHINVFLNRKCFVVKKKNHKKTVNFSKRVQKQQWVLVFR